MTDEETPKPKLIIDRLPDTFQRGNLEKPLNPFREIETVPAIDRHAFDRFPFMPQEREGLDLSGFFDKEFPQLPESVLREMADRIRTFTAEYHATPTWEQLFDITGNTSPETARLLILCEGTGHSDLIDNLLIKNYLSANVRTGDIVLVEGNPAEQVVNRDEDKRFDFLPEDVIVMGWDDLQLFAEGDRLYNELDRINRELKSAEVPEAEKITLRIERNGYLLPQIKDVVICQRNQRLIQTLEHLSQEDEAGIRRVFVLAGANHVKDEQLLEYSAKQPYSILITKKKEV